MSELNSMYSDKKEEHTKPLSPPKSEENKQEEMPNPNDILQKAMIEPEKVEPSKYQEAIEMGKNQIKEALKIIDTIRSEGKAKIGSEVEYYNAELAKLKNIQTALKKAIDASGKRAAAIEQFNKDTKSKEDESAKLLPTKKLNFEGAKKEKDETEKAINELKNTIASKVNSIDGSKLAVFKKKKPGDATDKLVVCMNKFLDPSNQIIDADCKKGGEPIVAKIKTIDTTKLKVEILAPEKANLESLATTVDPNAKLIVEVLSAVLQQITAQAALLALEPKYTQVHL